MTSTNENIAQLRELTAQDLKSCDQVQERINGLREEIAKSPIISNANVLFGVEQELETARQVSKDIVRRIEDIYDLDKITATDREMLQVLNARQVACDKLVQLYAELSALQSESVGYKVKDAETEEREFLKEAGDAAKSRRSRKKSEEPELEEGLPTIVDEPLQRWPTPPTKTSDSSTDTDAERDDDEDDSAGSVAGSSEEHSSERDNEEDDEESNKSKWPLLYQILDVNPNTDERQWDAIVRLAYRKLASKHDPKLLPNDSDAPARWAAVTKAYETLKDPSKKQFYDMHGTVPVDLEGFDMSTLWIDDH